MSTAGSGKRATNRRRVRWDLARAAVRLFDLQSFDATTADEIADAAGVSRRTLFRHFATKGDIVFADHEERIARVEAFLAEAPPGRSPLDVVGDAAEGTIPSFTDPPEFFLARFRVLKNTPDLRHKEQAYGLEYARALVRYLRERLADHPLGDLLGEVIADAVVTVVNRAQRRWAASGGEADPVALTREGTGLLKQAFGPLLGEQGDGAVRSGATVIVMNPTGEVDASVMEKLSRVFETG